MGGLWDSLQSHNSRSHTALATLWDSWDSFWVLIAVTRAHACCKTNSRKTLPTIPTIPRVDVSQKTESHQAPSSWPAREEVALDSPTNKRSLQMPSTEREQTQLCRQCLQQLPLAEFRLVKKGQKARRRQCRECHRVEMEVRKEATKGKNLQRFAREVASSRYSDRWVFRELVEHILPLFGGARGLAQFWSEQVKACPPGSRLGLYTGPALFRMMAMVEQPEPKPKPRDLDALSLEQIEGEIDELVERKARELVGDMQASGTINGRTKQSGATTHYKSQPPC